MSDLDGYDNDKYSIGRGLTFPICFLDMPVENTDIDKSKIDMTLVSHEDLHARNMLLKVHQQFIDIKNSTDYIPDKKTVDSES